MSRENLKLLPTSVPCQEGEEQLDELYRAADVMRFATAGDDDLVYFRAEREVYRVPSDLVRLLPYCTRFRTICGHAEVIARSPCPRPVETAEIQQKLQELRDRNLLIPASSFLHILATQNQAHFNPMCIVKSVGVVTRNRPQALKRTLASLIDNTKKHGRAINILVFDDSETSATQNDQREMLKWLKQKHGGEIRYATPARRSRFAEAVSMEAGVPPEVVRFGLHGIPSWPIVVGANRNALLLETAGELFISVDDDVLCQFVTSPGPIDQVSLTSQYDSSDYWFYESRDHLLQSVRFTDCDLVALHESLLGRSVSECAASAREEDLLHLEYPAVRQIQRGEGAILLTQLGMVGDCGMSSPRWLDLTGESRGRLLVSENTYRSAFMSRETMRLVAHLTASTGSFCMTSCIGFDNRLLLPPFLPIGRTSDHVFAVTLRRMWEHGWLGHLPWAVYHSPTEPRQFPPRALWKDASENQLADVIVSCLSAFQFWQGQPSGQCRLEILGKHLVTLASMTPSDFLEFLRLQTWQRMSKMLQHYQDMIQKHNAAPDYWARDVRRFMEVARASYLRPEFVVPANLHFYGPDDSVRHLQEIVMKFGELLQAWGDIVKAAKKLRAADFPLMESL